MKMIFRGKSGRVTFLGSLSSSLMPSFGKILGVVTRIFGDGQTSEVVDMPSMKLNYAIHSHTVSECDKYKI